MREMDFTFPKKEGLRTGFHTFRRLQTIYFFWNSPRMLRLVPKSPFSVEKNEIISFQFFFIKNNYFY
jgi:hypothetical protein